MRPTAPINGRATWSGAEAGYPRRLPSTSRPRLWFSNMSDTCRRPIAASPRPSRDGRCPGAARHADDAARMTGKDDWATIASTGMVQGRVREAEGRLEEAERLLREAVEVINRTDFSGWEEQLALAEFLLRRGRTAEGNEWLEKARESVVRFGPESPLRGFVDRRAAAAAAAAGSAP